MARIFHIPGKTTLQVEYNPTFKLFLHTKIANPHYKPELQVSQSQGGLVTVNFVCCLLPKPKILPNNKNVSVFQYITSLLCMHNVHGYELYISMFTFPKDSDRYERVCTALSVNWNDISSLTTKERQFRLRPPWSTKERQQFRLRPPWSTSLWPEQGSRTSCWQRCFSLIMFFSH